MVCKHKEDSQRWAEYIQIGPSILKFDYFVIDQNQQNERHSHSTKYNDSPVNTVEAISTMLVYCVGSVRAPEEAVVAGGAAATLVVPLEIVFPGDPGVDDIAVIVDFPVVPADPVDIGRPGARVDELVGEGIPERGRFGSCPGNVSFGKEVTPSLAHSSVKLSRVC